MIPDAAAACGLTENCNILRISAEILNIAFDPFQTGKLIEHAEVAGSIRLFS